MQSGKFFGQGFINGLAGQRAPAAKASSELAGASITGLRSTLAAPSAASMYGSTLAATRPVAATTAGGTTVNAPITVQGVVESDAQLSRRITREFTEVLYVRS